MAVKFQDYVDRWTDAEGNIWYKDFVRMRNGL
jgi:hypothetical protein